jgi:hypothetical protein
MAPPLTVFAGGGRAMQTSIVQRRQPERHLDADIRGTGVKWISRPNAGIMADRSLKMAGNLENPPLVLKAEIGEPC